MIERPARSLWRRETWGTKRERSHLAPLALPQNKNLQTPAKRRMKALSESRHALARRAGLILLFDGEVGLNVGQAARLSHIESHDEHRQTDILTSGLEPHSRLPGL